VVTPARDGGGRGDLVAGPPQEQPSAFSVEWQLPLPTRDLIVQQDTREVVVDVRDVARVAALELFVAASPSAWERGGHLTRSGGLSDTPKRR
jgi:hypothetical protein